MTKTNLILWYQKYLRTFLANQPLPLLPPPPGPEAWTAALRATMRETPVLPCKPDDPGVLVGRTFWKLFENGE
jgi:hypothetical protein